MIPSFPGPFRSRSWPLVDRLSVPFVFLSLVLVLPVFAQGPSTHGRWVSQFKMRDPQATGVDTVAEGAIHMAVMRGRADSTHVLYWTHGHTARLMLNAVDSTNARHVNVPTGNPGNPNYVESFCAGHAGLADGRLFVAGGAFGSAVPSGSRFAGIFDAAQYGNATSGWTEPDSMPSNRWYPTCTTLPDGTVLVTQGEEHFQLMAYGGRATNDVSQKDLRTYAITSASPFWRSEQVVAQGTTQYERTGHTATFLNAETAVALFGGKTAANQYLSSPQFAYREDTNDSTQRWILYNLTAAGGTPIERWKHAAVSLLDNEMVLLGGQGAGDTALPYIHKLHKISGQWNWTPLNPTGESPLPRYGHVAVFDPGPPGSPADSGRILLFGGRNTAGLSANTVYVLRLTVSPSWYVAVDGSPDSNVAPAKREGHAAIF